MVLISAQLNQSVLSRDNAKSSSDLLIKVLKGPQGLPPPSLREQLTSYEQSRLSRGQRPMSRGQLLISRGSIAKRRTCALMTIEQ